MVKIGSHRCDERNGKERQRPLTRTPARLSPGLRECSGTRRRIPSLRPRLPATPYECGSAPAIIVGTARFTLGRGLSAHAEPDHLISARLVPRLPMSIRLSSITRAKLVRGTLQKQKGRGFLRALWLACRWGTVGADGLRSPSRPCRPCRRRRRPSASPAFPSASRRSSPRW